MTADRHIVTEKEGGGRFVYCNGEPVVLLREFYAVYAVFRREYRHSRYIVAKRVGDGFEVLCLCEYRKGALRVLDELADIYAASVLKRR